MRASFLLLLLCACSKKPDEPAARARSSVDAAGGDPDPAMFGVSFDLDAGRAPPAESDLPPGAPFEGTIGAFARVAGEDAPERDARPLRYDFTVKGKLVRWDLFSDARANAGWRVFDGDERSFSTVDPRESIVYVTSEASLSGDAGARRDFHLKTIAYNPKGRVAGHDCERWEARDDAYRYEMCVAKDLVPFPIHLLGGAVSEVLPFNAELEKRGYFPLSASRFPARTAKDAGAWRPPDRVYGVTELVRRKVAPENFRIPGEYPKIPRATLQSVRVLL